MMHARIGWPVGSKKRFQRKSKWKGGPLTARPRNYIGMAAAADKKKENPMFNTPIMQRLKAAKKPERSKFIGRARVGAMR